MEKNEITAPQTILIETFKEQLPAGWRRDKNGAFVYTPFPEEIKEMRRTDNLIFGLATFNILQALFTIILVLSRFCNH